MAWPVAVVYCGCVSAFAEVHCTPRGFRRPLQRDTCPRRDRLHPFLGVDDDKLSRYVLVAGLGGLLDAKGHLIGRGYMEDPVSMLKKYPLINDYWKDKRAEVSQIQVPAYVLASYSTFLHLPGSLRGFEEIPHNNKW